MSWMTLSEIRAGFPSTPSADELVDELVLLGHRVRTSKSSRVDTLYCRDGLVLKQRVTVVREEYRSLAEDLADYLVECLQSDNTLEWDYHGLYDGERIGTGASATYTARIAVVTCTCGPMSGKTSTPTVYPSQDAGMQSVAFTDGPGYPPTEGRTVEAEASRANEADGFHVIATTTIYGVPYSDLARNPWLPWYPMRQSFTGERPYEVSRDETIDLVCYDNGKKILQHVRTVVTEFRSTPIGRVDALVSGNTSQTSKSYQYAVPIGSGTGVGWQYFNVRSGSTFANASATTTQPATDRRATARLTDEEKNLFTVTVTSNEYWITREAV